MQLVPATLTQAPACTQISPKAWSSVGLDRDKRKNVQIEGVKHQTRIIWMRHDCSMLLA